LQQLFWRCVGGLDFFHDSQKMKTE
jgi:hypothetical protein